MAKKIKWTRPGQWREKFHELQDHFDQAETSAKRELELLRSKLADARNQVEPLEVEISRLRGELLKAVELRESLRGRIEALKGDLDFDGKVLLAQRELLVRLRLIVLHSGLAADAMVLSNEQSVRRHDYWGPKCVVRDVSYHNAVRWAHVVQKDIARESILAAEPIKPASAVKAPNG